MTASLEPLYRAEYVGAVHLVRLLVGDHHRAEGLAQEAFVRIAPRLASVDEPGTLLRTILVNLCRDQAGAPDGRPQPACLR